MAGCAARVLVAVLMGNRARRLPGRRVAGAGVVVVGSGVCVGMESFDDLDMVENVLPRVEDLRDPFLNKLNGMLLFRFVGAGWHNDVS